MHPVLSALIVHRNTPELLLDCVDSLRHAASELEGVVEILVADCGSAAESKPRIGSPGVAVHQYDNIGYGAALNRLAALASGGTLLLSNADMIYHPGSLAQMLAALGASADVAAVGPRLWLDHERTVMLPPSDPVTMLAELETRAARSSRRLAAALRNRKLRAAERFWKASEPLGQEMISGASMMIGAADLQRIGGLDERFFLYHEDADLCRRLRSEGRVLFVPDADVTHLFSRSASQEGERAPRWFAESRRAFFRKHFGRVGSVLLKLPGAGAPAQEAPTDVISRGRDGSLRLPDRCGQGDLLLFSPLPSGWPATATRADDDAALGAKAVDALPPFEAATLSLYSASEREVVARYSIDLGSESGAARTGEDRHRAMAAADEASIRRLFAAVFGRGMSSAEFRWKYLSPQVRPSGNVALNGGQVVSHYGGRSHPATWRGEPVRIADVTDVMSHPDHRGRGVFQEAAGTWMEMTRGSDDAFAFGFPSDEHRAIGEALLGYKPVGRVLVLSKPVEAPARLPGEIVVAAEPPADWDLHWPALRAIHEIVVGRDRARLKWRYSQRPDRSYEFLTVPGLPLLAVVAVEGEQAWLMEMLLAPGDEAGAARLALGAEALAAAAGARRLSAWFPPGSQQALLLTALGWSGERSGPMIVAMEVEGGPSLGQIAAGLFYSLGDYDMQ